MSSAGVTLLRWPDEEPRRAALAAHGSPRLLVVAESAPPPICFDELEDWVREPLDPDEIEARVAVLAERAAPAPTDLALDEDDRVLWRGARRVQLSEAQVPVVRLLLDRRGQVVPREELMGIARKGDTSDDPRAIKSLVGRIDKRTRELGLEIHNVRGRGWMLVEADVEAGVEPPARPPLDAFAVSSFVSNKSETWPEATSAARILVAANGLSRTDR